MGPWAFMCEIDFMDYGMGLGTGYGQRLIKAEKTILTSVERDRLVGLIDLLNSSATQLDTDEQAEFSALLGKLTGE
jgi:hypothetical protein